MIDLAPNHKLGLVVANPILLAGGTVGFGEATAPGLDLSKLGAVVIGPLTLHNRAGSEAPRLAEVNGGFVLETGQQNRGLDATLRNFGRLWPKLRCPVIAQLADTDPSALTRVAARLGELSVIAGLELLLPQQCDAALLRTLVRAATQASDLPVWVKLPLDLAVGLAPVAVQAEAVGVVIGQPPAGAAYSSLPGTPLVGKLYGPLVFPQMFAILAQVAKLQLPCALIACGGIHTVAHVQQALACGAQAVQIDSAVWVEPGLPSRILSEMIA